MWVKRRSQHRQHVFFNQSLLRNKHEAVSHLVSFLSLFLLVRVVDSSFRAVLAVSRAGARFIAFDVADIVRIAHPELDAEAQQFGQFATE